MDDKGRKEDSAKDSISSKHPEFSSPLSFMEAWDLSFFTAPALLLLSTLGFVVNSVPTLDKLSLGGRLRPCILNWRKVCNNFLVMILCLGDTKYPLSYLNSTPLAWEFFFPGHA